MSYKYWAFSLLAGAITAGGIFALNFLNSDISTDLDSPISKVENSYKIYKPFHSQIQAARTSGTIPTTPDKERFPITSSLGTYSPLWEGYVSVNDKNNASKASVNVYLNSVNSHLKHIPSDITNAVQSKEFEKVDELRIFQQEWTDFYVAYRIAMFSLSVK